MEADLVSTHPIANVLQSVAGAIAVMGSYIVRVEMCSDVEGSKSVTDPWAFPVVYVSAYQPSVRIKRALPKATFPFRMKDATLMGS
jgi:hypothetical protein